MIKQILDKLNIKTDSNQKWILLSLFISGLLITYTGPVIAKSIITALPAEWIAFQSLFSSISALIIGMMWSICCIIDDIGWIIVFNKNKTLLRKD